jgi:hypothetical protein
MEVVNKITKDKQELSRLISTMAIKNTYSQHKLQISKITNTNPKDIYIFNIRAYNESKTI